MKQNFKANPSDLGANPRINPANPPQNPALNEVESYMNQKGVEYRTIDKSRSKRIYGRLKAHITPPKRTIQVLGTNGKGSTGRFLALMLMQNGANVVHFTSPHIFSFSERFYKNGAIIGDDELLKAHRFLQGFDFMAECSYFEYATFLAIAIAQNVDYLILEAGVGGELDSTSVITRDLCVFSVIDYDHTEILGDSIEAIATTKLNAVFYPNRVPKMVVGAQKYKIVEKIARDIAEKNGVEFYGVESHKNSSLGASFALGENFGNQQTSSLILSQNFLQDTKSPPQILKLDSNKSESSDSSLRDSLANPANERSEFSWQSKQNNPCDSTPNLARFVVQKIGIKDAVVPSADFLLESDKRGSPPKSEKAATFWRIGGAGRGVQPFLRKEICESNIDCHDSTANLMQNFRHTERSEVSKSRESNQVQNAITKERMGESHKFTQSQQIIDDSKFAKMDSSLRTSCYAQNDESMHDLALQNLAMTGNYVDCFGDESLRNDGVEKYLQKHRLAGFLRQNLILALKALEILGLKCDFETLPKLDLRGRFEQIAPNIIIDVGHNQNAAFAVKENLGQKKVILVYNSYFQKNISEILGILKDNILRVEILEVADNPRIIERKTLENILDSLGILYQNFNGVDSMDSQNNYLVFGSFSVVEAFMSEFMSGAK